MMARRIFPGIPVLMLEAQEGQRRDLEKVKQELGSGVDYRIALLGPEDRENVVFNELTSAPHRLFDAFLSARRRDATSEPPHADSRRHPG